MRYIVALATVLLSVFHASGETYIESFNNVSEDSIGFVHDIELIRNINGGTVIIPEFDSSCPEEMKGPFMYACKIVEEYMPPCLPLRVAVSCGQIRGNKRAISSVKARSCVNFGHSAYDNVQMSVVKGVILAELCYDEDVSYLRYVPNLEFLTDLPDISIVYNQQKLEDISFSLEATAGSKYDFVSLVVRDLLIGLGMSSSYTYNYVDNSLKDPSQAMTPFESAIDRALGNYGNATARLENATKGEVIFTKNGRQPLTLKLYAPNPFVNGVSLNYFIPQEDCSLSQVLSHEFGKGTVSRSLNDSYSSWIFKDLLGWNPNYTVSETTPSNSVSGSTSMLMPYNGSISISENAGKTYEIVLSNSGTNKMPRIVTSDNELTDYINSFHPFLSEYTPVYDGVSISVLKKDGSWDLVKFEGAYIPDMTYNMSDWTFHHSDEEYARTVDGYLRARLTTKQIDNNNRTKIRSTFFVIDYLPQKTNISYSYNAASSPAREPAQGASVTQSTPVRLYFSNLEGTKRLVLERLREGFRMPSKREIEDFKCGYFDTTIDRNTTFTAVAYNDNGYSRSIPVKVEMMVPSDLQNTEFEISDNTITLKLVNGEGEDLEYQIFSITKSDLTLVLDGTTKGDIDISSLTQGAYLLILDPHSNKPRRLKFAKK